MGSSVADQICAVVVDREPLDEQNAHALRQGADFLAHVARAAKEGGDSGLEGEARRLARDIEAHIGPRFAAGRIVSGAED